jgi:hypothetical protein
MRTLVDCGCETKVHKDGSGVELYLCPLHEAAPDMLAELEECRKELLGSSCYLETCDPVTIVENFDSFIASLKRRLAAVEAAIRKAKGE